MINLTGITRIMPRSGNLPEAIIGVASFDHAEMSMPCLLQALKVRLGLPNRSSIRR
jgi:hypothetical protein